MCSSSNNKIITICFGTALCSVLCRAQVGGQKILIGLYFPKARAACWLPSVPTPPIKNRRLSREEGVLQASLCNPNNEPFAPFKQIIALFRPSVTVLSRSTTSFCNSSPEALFLKSILLCSFCSDVLFVGGQSFLK